MLEKTTQELVGGKCEGVLRAGGRIAVGEGDTLVVLRQEPGARDGSLIDIAGQIAECLLSAARMLVLPVYL